MLKFCAKIKELVNYEYLPVLNAPGVKFKVGHTARKIGFTHIYS